MYGFSVFLSLNEMYLEMGRFLESYLDCQINLIVLVMI